METQAPLQGTLAKAPCAARPRIYVRLCGTRAPLAEPPAQLQGTLAKAPSAARPRIYVRLRRLCHCDVHWLPRGLEYSTVKAKILGKPKSLFLAQGSLVFCAQGIPWAQPSNPNPATPSKGCPATVFLRFSAGCSLAAAYDASCKLTNACKNPCLKALSKNLTKYSLVKYSPAAMCANSKIFVVFVRGLVLSFRLHVTTSFTAFSGFHRLFRPTVAAAFKGRLIGS